MSKCLRKLGHVGGEYNLGRFLSTARNGMGLGTQFSGS